MDRPDSFGQACGIVQGCGRDSLGDVLADVVDDGGCFLDGAAVDDVGAAGGDLPESGEEVLGEVGAFDETVQVGMPAFEAGIPFDFEEGTAAGDVVTPVGGAAKAIEGGVEVIEELAEGLVGRVDSEGQELDPHELDVLGEICGDEAGS